MIHYDIFCSYLKDWFSSIFSEKSIMYFQVKKKGSFRIKHIIALKGRDRGRRPVNGPLIFYLYLEERSIIH